MIAALVFALFQLVQGAFGMKRVGTILSDCIFLAVLFCILGLSSYYATALQIRPYVFLGNAMGFFTMKLAIQPLIGRIARSIGKLRAMCRKNKADDGNK